MFRIALVDNDCNLLTSLSVMFESEGFEVTIYQDGQLALSAFTNHMPDIAILDVTLPGLNGLDLLQKIRNKSAIPVIFLTAKNDEIDEVLGLRMGADDYVKKPCSQRVLLERVHNLLRRLTIKSTDPIVGSGGNTIIERGPLIMDPLCHAVKWNGADVSLTVTEFLLLQNLAQRPGYVKSRDQLMDVAYDEQVYVDDRTIDSHIKRLRKKIRFTDPNFKAIETIYGIGYRFNEE